MKLVLLRHATLLLEYGGTRLLLDPLLGPAGSLPPEEAKSGDRRPNPLVELPVSLSALLADVEAVLVTHTHADHFDPVAAAKLPKGLPLFCQPSDLAKLRSFGFVEVWPVERQRAWRGITLTRTGGRHGRGSFGEALGPVSGFVLRGDGEPTLYVAGDTVWCPEVVEALEQQRPDVIVLFAGAAEYPAGGPITMDAADVCQVGRAAPQARLVAVHLEAFNHCGLTRQELKETLEREGLDQRVAIPPDGGTLAF